MELKPIEIQLKNIAFILGVLQGIAYAVMGLICIILYNQDVINFDLSDTSYMDVVNQNMYFLLLWPKGYCGLFDYTLCPQVFTGFAWVYFFLNLGWVGISIEASRKKGVTLPNYLTAWSHLTLLISVWDFITVVILGSDYSKCLDWAGSFSSSYSEISFQGTCSTGFLTALVIAAKGFVLWIVNVIFAVILRNMAKELKKAGQVYSQPVVPPLVFQAQPPPVQRQPSGYISQSPRTAPYVPSPPQNTNQNHFDYPVTIPEPDYHQNRHQSPPARRY